MKITENQVSIRVSACYFAPKGSKTYKKKHLDREDPYSSLKNDISAFSSLGEILIIGDFNARMENNQTLNLKRSYKETSDPLRLEEELTQY